MFVWQKNLRRAIPAERAIMTVDAGTLYIVGTPIGNLQDISLRALDVLAAVDICLVEDTRHAKKLFTRYEITTTMKSCYRFNEKNRISSVHDQLRAGKSIALISDAGMPGISDPGERLIRDTIDAGLPVEVIPGPTSVMQALLLAGMRLDRFSFEGFIPRKGNKRNKRLRAIEASAGTVVLFESPIRLGALLNDLLKVCGNRRVAVCRELTKQFEQTVRGRISELIESIEHDDIVLKGEIVLVIEGKEAFDKDPDLDE